MFVTYFVEGIFCKEDLLPLFVSLQIVIAQGSSSRSGAWGTRLGATHWRAQGQGRPGRAHDADRRAQATELPGRRAGTRKGGGNSCRDPGGKERFVGRRCSGTDGAWGRNGRETRWGEENGAAQMQGQRRVQFSVVWA
jgi:hypothetical protein